MKRVLFIFLIILSPGPLVGGFVSIFHLALAPPWTFLTDSIVPAILGLSLFIGLIVLLSSKLAGRIKLMLLLLLFLLPVITLVFLREDGKFITGMTNCQSLPAAPAQARYACVSTSSDNDYRYEFTLEGPQSSPFMSIVSK